MCIAAYNTREHNATIKLLRLNHVFHLIFYQVSHSYKIAGNIIVVYIVTWRLKVGIAESEKTSIARQQLGKHIPAAKKAQSTIEEMPFLSNGEVNTFL
jgi:ribosomal protein L30/L7E